LIRRRGQVTLNGAPVLLSAREFAVLEALMQRPGALLSRAQLEDRLYGWGEEIESNAVSVYIHQLAAQARGGLHPERAWRGLLGRRFLEVSPNEFDPRARAAHAAGHAGGRRGR
jgi:hypothetical protein